MCHADHLKLIHQNVEIDKNQQQNLQSNSFSKILLNRVEQSFDIAPKIPKPATSQKRTMSLPTCASMLKKPKNVSSNPPASALPTSITNAGNTQAPTKLINNSMHDNSLENLLPIPTNN